MLQSTLQGAPGGDRQSYNGRNTQLSLWLLIAWASYLPVSLCRELEGRAGGRRTDGSAWRRVEAAAEAGLVCRERASELRNAAEASVDHSATFLVKSFGGVLFSLLILLLTSPLAGARRRGIFYVKRRVGRFCHALQQVCGRAGPHNSCIST